MNDLIARLEKAPGPDRQLDLAIHTAIFGQPSEDNLDELLAPEAYTDSVDAALMLVPEGWRTERAYQGPRGGVWKWILAPIPEGAGHYGKTHEREQEVFGFSKCGPALALCIAAMKAREPK